MALVVLFAQFMSHYACSVRPGVFFTAVFCHFKAFNLQLFLSLSSDTMMGDFLKTFIYVVCMFLLDAIVIPDKVFAPLMKQQQQQVQSVADLRRKVFLLQQRGGTTGDAATLKMFNEKMYKSASVLSGTVLLCLASKPMINALLQVIVYEPQRIQSRLYFLVCMYTRVNVFSANYTKMDLDNLWMFVSLSALPLMFYIFVFLIAAPWNTETCITRAASLCRRMRSYACSSRIGSSVTSWRCCLAIIWGRVVTHHQIWCAAEMTAKKRDEKELRLVRTLNAINFECQERCDSEIQRLNEDAFAEVELYQ